MKISALIHQLEAFKATEGDINVIITDENGNEANIELTSLQLDYETHELMIEAKNMAKT